ncbi:uncharacterized protein LOC134204672 [Armigeres subalbatus]|uniref:uncharacterized protein LOC134204672 n=1 Tax=Armigeres subalbatus TaxID=124917 RepID=UPI002ED5DEAE
MDPASLTEEEIGYELALRHVTNLGSLPRRARAVRLRALMQEDEIKNTIYDTSSHVMEAVDNISQCQSEVSKIVSELDGAFKRGDLPAVRVIRSRLIHYRDRLAIVEPPANHSETHATLSLLVQFSLEDTDDALGRTKKQVRTKVNSDSAKNTGAVPKGTMQTSTSPGANFRGFDENGDPREQSNEENQDFVIQTEEVRQQSRSTPTMTDPLAALPTRNSPNVQGSEHGAESLEVQRVNRGRGYRNASQRPTVQSSRYSLQKESSMREPTFSSFAPPPYESRTEAVEPDVREDSHFQEYNQLRNELLRNLNQRWQNRAPYRNQGWQDNVPRPLFEERRTLKAIHNWPFRYKGEKDGSSLNTFLQRVETFAASEEIADDLLLKSVKHLLLDDALNWYSNMYATGVFGSWEDFKRLIRHEFLPASYAYILRAEAYHRMQGEEEPFNKFYQDISTLFQYVDPPMSDLEKLFIIKKNMNSTYAPIAASQNSMRLLVKACKELDELRKLQQYQRRISLPYGALIEPALATPNPSQRQAKPQHPLQRFERVHALEADNAQSYTSGEVPVESDCPEEEKIDQRMEAILQQVNALKLRFDRREVVGRQVFDQQRQQSSGGSSNLQQGEVPEATTADGTEHMIQSYTRLPVAYNNKNEVVTMLLLPTLPTREGKEVKQEATKELCTEEHIRLQEAINKFPKAEPGKLGRTDRYTHRIDIGDAKPRKQRYYPMSKYVLDEVNKEIDRMLELDVIEEALFSP